MERWSSPFVFFLTCLLSALSALPTNSGEVEQGLSGRSEISPRERRSYGFLGKQSAWGNGPDSVKGIFGALTDQRNDDFTGGRRERCRRSNLVCLQQRPSSSRTSENTPFAKPKAKYKCRDLFDLRYADALYFGKHVAETKVELVPKKKLRQMGLRGEYTIQFFIVALDASSYKQHLTELHQLEDEDEPPRKLTFRDRAEFFFRHEFDFFKPYKVKVFGEDGSYFCKGMFFLFIQPLPLQFYFKMF